MSSDPPPQVLHHRHQPPPVQYPPAQYQPHLSQNLLSTYPALSQSLLAGGPPLSQMPQSIPPYFPHPAFISSLSQSSFDHLGPPLAHSSQESLVPASHSLLTASVPPPLHSQPFTVQEAQLLGYNDSSSSHSSQSLPPPGFPYIANNQQLRTDFHPPFAQSMLEQLQASHPRLDPVHLPQQQRHPLAFQPRHGCPWLILELASGQKLKLKNNVY